jgi:DNA-binding response OmpR family regulator
MKRLKCIFVPLQTAHFKSRTLKPESAGTGRNLGGWRPVSTQSIELELSGTSAQRVLVVEDEVLIRLVIAEYLRECGYRVREAANAAEAVTVLEAPHVTIDIVFSDVLMPGEMDGFGLARWVRAHRPQVQVILTSTIDRSAEIAGMLCEAEPMLEKPYEPQLVVDRIKRLLAKVDRLPCGDPNARLGMPLIRQPTAHRPRRRRD